MIYMFTSGNLGAGLGLDSAGFFADLQTFQEDFLTQFLGPGFWNIGWILAFGVLAALTVRLFLWVRSQL